MNCLNIIIISERVLDRDRELLFPDEEIVFTIRSDNPIVRDMLDVLVLMKVFPSRSQARKNWKGSIPFPTGWNEWFLGKKKRHLCLWNPE